MCGIVRRFIPSSEIDSNVSRNLVLLFCATSVLFIFGCGEDSQENRSSNVDSHQYSWEMKVVDDRDAPSKIAEMWNFPEEKIHPLSKVAIIENPLEKEIFLPGYLRYKNGTLYAFDEAYHNVFKFSNDLEYVGKEFKDDFIDVDRENILCLRIDDNNTVILTGANNIYFSGDNPYKLRNLYSIHRLIPYQDRLYSENWEWQLSPKEAMFDIFDYELNFKGNAGKQFYFMSKDGRTTDKYTIVQEDKIYIVPNLYLTLGIMDLNKHEIISIALNVGNKISEMELHNNKYIKTDSINLKAQTIFKDGCVFEGKIYALSEFKKTREDNFIVITEFDKALELRNIYYCKYADGKKYKIYIHYFAAFKHNGLLSFALTSRATVEKLEESSIIQILAVERR